MTAETKDSSIKWAVAKNATKTYLEKLQIDHGLSAAEVAYDIIAHEEKMATFKIHNTLKMYIENEVKRKGLSKSNFRINFSRIDDTTWAMRLETGGYESYNFCGMLGGVIAFLDAEKGRKLHASKEAVHGIISQVLEEMRVKEKLSFSLKNTKGTYQLSIKFKELDIQAIEIQDSNIIKLMTKITQELPRKIKEGLKHRMS